MSDDVRVTVETPTTSVKVRVKPRRRQRRMSRKTLERWRVYLDQFSVEVRWTEATETQR